MNRRTPSSLVESLETRRLLSAAASPVGVSNTDVLASFSAKDGIAAVVAYLKAHPKSTLASYVDLKHSKQLFVNGNTSLLQVRMTKGVTSASTVKLLKAVTGARWASPNYLYSKGGAESTPTDPKYATEANAFKQIGLEQAWDNVTVDKNLIVAVIDDGFDSTNEDLQNVTWTNKGEIPGNGIDDDHNGYVDDVHGWDFGSGDNNTTPAFDSTYQLTDSHGTQVASVIAANVNNGVGLAGIANGVQLMPIRFRGADVTVTSADIAQSVSYAVNNGAKIINLSYSFDPYMNDPAFYAAVDLAYSKGVLWINSSGNSNVANPPRTTIDKIIFVNNVDNTDTRASDSDFGTGTDISAPGTNVMAASPGNQYYPVSGTSYSSAVTTSIAALIWSKHPTWTRDQVAAQLLGTVDNIDTQNPAYVGLLGTGRVNAYKAVSGTVAAPTFRSLVGIANGAALTASPATLSLGTLSVLDPTTVTAGNFELRGAGADGKFDTADDTTVPLTISSTYAYASNKIDFALGTTLPTGNYRFTAKTAITDPFGTHLASAYVSTFAVAPAAPSAPTNLTAVTPSYSQTEAALSWTDTSDNETGFVIERSGSATFATIDKTFAASANTNRFNDWGLVQGTTYYYRIRGINASGQGNNSNTATLAILLPPAGIPAAPSALTGTKSIYSDTEVALAWTDNSNNETSFTIQRSTSSTFATVDNTLTAVAGSNTYYDWGLTAGTTYYYRVQAVNGKDVSTWSNTLKYVTPGGTVVTPPVTPPVVAVPVAPTGLTAASKAAAVVLKWKDNAQNEAAYEIERSLTSTFLLLNTTFTTPAGTTTYTDTVLITGLTYYYRVRATNSAGQSAWSSVVAVKA